ncbi:MAG: hypothetical protein LBB18_02510 [Puniceicoccales bacterium]|jgi:hypothetical protein|nr:hypothetical protein [Puniceicoccales bacterium]
MMFDSEKFLTIAPLASFLVALILWHGECKKNEKLSALSDKMMHQNILSNVNFAGRTVKTLIYITAPIFYSLIIAEARTNHLSTLLFILAVEPLIPVRKRDSLGREKRKKHLYN